MIPHAMTENKMSPVHVIADRCTGCGICVESCPVDVFRLGAVNGKSRPAYWADCQVCFLCHEDCPERAIVVEYTSASLASYSVYGRLDEGLLSWTQEESEFQPL